METGELLCGLNGGDRVGNRRRLDRDLPGLIQFVVCEGLVQEGKELFTPVMIMFPRVFTVQNDGNDELLLGRVVEDAPQAPQNIFGGGFGRRLVVDESECVGDLAVAKQYGQSILVSTAAIGLIERRLSVPWTAAHFQRACEDAFVRGEPAETGLMDKRKHLRTHRPF